MKLENKVAFLTGCGKGIGKRVAHRFGKEGAKCIVTGRNYSDIKEVAEEIKRNGGEAIAFELDISNLEDIDTVINQATDQYLRIDILFNNAGVFDMAPFLEASPKSFDILFSINVKGTFFVMQSVAKHMVENKTHGKIINVSSQAGRRGEALVSHYCATKAAIISYTQSAALALAKHSINVNGIAPGVIDTPMWDKVDSLFSKYEKRPLGDAKKEVGENVPLGRMGIPEDLEGTAVFLASNDSDYITAQTINVDGGNWMS